MSGGCFPDDEGALPRRASRGDTIDDGSIANNRGSEDATPHAVVRRLRNDPAGRRSLTGYEFRHRRSR